MKHIYIEDTLTAVKNCICPYCRAVPFFTSEWNIIRANENLMYCRCLTCDSAFKFMRRTLNHFKDSTGWEYILQDIEGKLYGIRGYYISMKTYKKNLSQYQLIRNHYQYGLNEIDDIYKEITGDKKEGIYGFVGKAFHNDEHLRNKTRLINWHYDESPDPDYILDDDDLLAELDNM